MEFDGTGMMELVEDRGEVPDERKWQIFIESILFLRKVKHYSSYCEILERILPVIDKNNETFQKQGRFLNEEMQEYVKAYEMFWNEYVKRQVWVAGSREDCNAVGAILDYGKVHLNGEIQDRNGLEDIENDYIIICGDISENELKGLEKTKVIRFDFIRLCAWKISPESAYLDMALRRKIKDGIEGAVTGLSYQQRGIHFEKLEKKLACLAAPSQDLFVDFHKFVWLYNQAAQKQERIKYCIIGMDFYRLWYDLSLSSQRERMLCFYQYSESMHHNHEWDAWLKNYHEDFNICGQLMVEDYMEKDYCNCFHPQRVEWDRTSEYKADEKTYQADCQKIKTLFNKPYPATFEENRKILRDFLEFLKACDIKTLVFIPPFPKVFNDFTDPNMKKTTLEALEGLKNTYQFDMLDLSSHKLFEENRYFADYNHLNSRGADLVTEMLNDYMRQNWN